MSLDLLQSLLNAANTVEANSALSTFLDSGVSYEWVPVGARDNNRGTIEVSADPGRALVERVTNGIDAVLEDEHQRHAGKPDCKSPREAAQAWLSVPEKGLSQMTPRERRQIADKVCVRVFPGDSKESRIFEVRDYGIGLSSEEMPRTILSLNESNKMSKHYLAGAYGQGGSSTFAASKLTLIASRKRGSNDVAFTAVRYRDLPPDKYKTGHYVYLRVDRVVPVVPMTKEIYFEPGTLVRHFGYDLSSYDSSFGPGSVYGLLQSTLFDPVIPVWLDNRVRDYRRVIKGVRNALNGAVDEGDDNKPTLPHNMPMMFLPIGEDGHIGLEYWVLDAPKKDSSKPSQVFVNSTKPILLTLNGQTQAEISATLIRRDAELPYLTNRLICHIDCNHLTPAALRQLFVSNREAARSGSLLEKIREEVVSALRSDDNLLRLNIEARNATLKQKDDTAIQEARKAVARLLKMQGIDLPDMTPNAAVAAKEASAKPSEQVPRPHTPRPLPEPIELHEPPTYIRFVSSKDDSIKLYPGRRIYVRIETDADSSYHNPMDPKSSRINFIVGGDAIDVRSSSPLSGGRMRIVVDARGDTAVGNYGDIRVDLSRPGLAPLSDSRLYEIVKPPTPKADERKVHLPPFEFVGVNHSDSTWVELDWPQNFDTIASQSEIDAEKHTVYYSREFPAFKSKFNSLEQRNPSLARSFENRYAIWLVVHSLLHQHQASKFDLSDDDQERADAAERAERVRVATLSAMIAQREVRMSELAGVTLNDE